MAHLFRMVCCMVGQRAFIDEAAARFMIGRVRAIEVEPHLRELFPPITGERLLALIGDPSFSLRLEQVRGPHEKRVLQGLLPLLTSTRCELPASPRLQAQLLGLERRVTKGGRDVIDHAPRAHDDLANAVAGALVLATNARRRRPAPRELMAAVKEDRPMYDLVKQVEDFEIKTHQLGVRSTSSEADKVVEAEMAEVRSQHERNGFQMANKQPLEDYEATFRRSYDRELLASGVQLEIERDVLAAAVRDAIASAEPLKSSAQRHGTSGQNFLLAAMLDELQLARVRQEIVGLTRGQSSSTQSTLRRRDHIDSARPDGVAPRFTKSCTGRSIAAKWSGTGPGSAIWKGRRPPRRDPKRSGCASTGPSCELSRMRRGGRRTDASTPRARNTNG
jgi:hypothetical protein